MLSDVTGVEIVLGGVLKYLFVPVAKHAYGRFVATSGDKVTDTVLEGLAERVKKARGDKEKIKAAVEQAEKSLGKAGVDPSAVLELAKDVMTAAPADGLDRNQRVLQATWAFIASAIDMAAELERPVALPGFVTGPDWLCVIDARDTEPDIPTDPLLLITGPEDNVSFMGTLELSKRGDRIPTKERGPDGATHKPDVVIPAAIACMNNNHARVWLIQVADAKTANDLAARIEPEFKKRAGQAPGVKAVEDFLRDLEVGEPKLLDAIDQESVYLYTDENGPGESFCSGGGGQSSRFEIEMETGDGMTSMRDALFAAVTEMIEQHEGYIQKASSPPNVRPSSGTT
jgi:hypothetical protein